ncbi:MAG: sugar transferase [Nitrospirae bacterium]|nr:sugar transferase [Nitrospirota bacterium]
MYRVGSRKYKAYLVAGDAAILLGVFFMAMEFWWDVGPEGLSESFHSGFIVLVAYVLFLFLFGLYNIRMNYRAQKASTMADISSAVLVASMALSALYYMLPDVKLPRGVFLIQTIFAVPLLFFWRTNFWRLRDESLVPRNVLIVGAGEAGATALNILERFHSEYHVVGFIDDALDKQARTINNYKVLGGSVALVTLVRQHRVEGIVVAVVGQKQEQLIQAALQCRMQGVFVSDLLTLGEELTGRVLLEHARESWFVFSSGFLILHQHTFRRIKRLLDVLCATIGLVLASPIMLIAMALIKMETRGPVFYRQTRVGQNEQPFTVVKLRTMCADSEKGSLYTAQNDPRVTRIGRMLRLWRIDEIPQMWNVLKGDMSFVGPRAEWELLVREYQDKIPYYSFRHMAKPGITGWAQVNYRYGSSVGDAVRKLEYDLYYLKHMSVALDLKIIFKTISVVLLGQGSR